MTETTKVPEETSAIAPPETPPTEKAAGEKKKSSPPKTSKTSPSKEKDDLPEVTVAMKDIVLMDSWNRDKLGSVSDLVQSIKEKGLYNPLLVWPHPEKPGKMILVDGRRRYAALNEIGTNKVPVFVKNFANEEEAFAASLVANLNRKDNTYYEKARSFKQLVDTGWKIKSISKETGYSEGLVSQYVKLFKLPETVIESVKKDQVPFTKMRVLSRLADEEDTAFVEKMIPLSLDPEISAETLAEKIDVHLSKKKDGKERGKGAKTKAEKKRGPAPKMADYASPEVKKLMTPVKDKEKYIEYFTYYKEKREKTSSSKRQAFLDGVMEGLELGSGLKVLE